jgi:hypothetical protein
MLQHGEAELESSVSEADQVDRLVPAQRVDVESWQFDQTRLALNLSAAMPETVPDVLCPELGRRLLQAQLTFNSWVLRRVEKVEFERERSVSRRLTIDFIVRSDAPEFQAHDGKYWLVPLSIMRRRTLVNLDLWDESGQSLTLPGLRLNQQLDESVLLAAASTTAPEAVLSGTRGRTFIQKVVAGRKHEVDEEFDAFEKSNVDDGLNALRTNALFTETLYRMRRNFTLYLFLPVERHRHRLLRMAFDEPTSWRYQTSLLQAAVDAPAGLRGRASKADIYSDPETENVHRYQPGFRASWRHGFRSAIGLSPTRIRFQVPSAEHAASYHFEARAPLGLRIVRASLVAGRPNNPKRHVSADHWEGHSPTVGLHATQIPYGSLCRAQVDLRLPTAGWLTTLWVSCWLVFAVLASVAYHWYTGAAAAWDEDQATNVCVLLVSTSAGVATIIAQREFGGLAARLLVWMRGLGLVAISLPIVVAAFLAYSSGSGTPNQLFGQMVASYATATTSGIIAIYITVVWGLCKRDEWRVDAVDRRSVPLPGGRRAVRGRISGRRAEMRSRRAAHIIDSPWDMTRTSRPAAAEWAEMDQDFSCALRAHGFDEVAIGIRSAEGWHEWYAATDDSHRADVMALDMLKAGSPADKPVLQCGAFNTLCAARHGCRSHY